MKLRSKHITLGILGLFLVVGSSTQLFSNLWSLTIGHAYIIPKESSIFSFKSTMMNYGSDDYWLYGEDDTNYYTTLLNIEAGDTAKYFALSKEKAGKILQFSRHHYSTWFDVRPACGDILEEYAQKPKQLEFVKCETPENSQTIVRATYRISGNQSEEIEAFLVEKYGMGKLRWVCCGYETSGKYGGFEHSAFFKMHPFLSATIDMYGSGESGLEFERGEIDYFFVVVELWIV